MRTILITTIVAAFTLFASSAMAGAWDEAPSDGAWLPPVISVLLAILVVGSNMKNAKRGHQD